MKMLKPNKYTNVSLSIVGLGAEVISILKSDKQQKYDSLIDKLVRKKGQNSKENILLSLCFLHSIGKVIYYPENDVLELSN